MIRNPQDLVGNSCRFDIYQESERMMSFRLLAQRVLPKSYCTSSPLGAQGVSRSYTIPVVLESGALGERSFDIYSRMLRERIIFVHGQVTDQMASLVTAQLLFLESERPDQPVYMYINSPGGLVTAGMAMYDTMQVRPMLMLSLVLPWILSFGFCIAHFSLCLYRTVHSPGRSHDLHGAVCLHGQSPLGRRSTGLSVCLAECSHHVAPAVGWRPRNGRGY